MKVLFVDDAPFTRMVLKRCLEGAGYEARGVSSGAEAMALLKDEMPDLLVTDLLMDGVSGIELLQHVRQYYPALPVIVITADVQESTQNECKALGAVAVFPKGALYPNGQGLVALIETIKIQPAAGQ